MNSVDLAQVLGSQQVLRSAKLTLERPPKGTPLAEVFLQEYPAEAYWRFAFRKDAVERLEARSAKGTPMVAVRILAFLTGTAATPFPGQKAALLENGQLFVESRDIPLPSNSREELFLVTPEETLDAQIAGYGVIDGPHIYVTRRAQKFAAQNLEHFAHAEFMESSCWGDVLISLSHWIFSPSNPVSAGEKCAMCHKPIRSLLPALKLFTSTGGWYKELPPTPALPDGRSLLDISLMDTEKREEEAAPAGEQLEWVCQSAKHLNEVLQRKLLLKPLKLTAQVENRLRYWNKLAKTRMLKGSLVPGRFEGFSEIVELLPLGQQTILLVDQNGFSARYHGNLTESDLQGCVVPLHELEFPMGEYTRCPYRTADIEALFAIAPEEDPFRLVPQFLDYLSSRQSSRETVNPDNITETLFREFMEKKVHFLIAPNFPAVGVLSRRFGPPPYRFRHVLAADMILHSYGSTVHHPVADALFKQLEGMKAHEAILCLPSLPVVDCLMPGAESAIHGDCPACGGPLGPVEHIDAPPLSVPVIGCARCDKPLSAITGKT